MDNGVKNRMEGLVNVEDRKQAVLVIQKITMDFIDEGFSFYDIRDYFYEIMLDSDKRSISRFKK